MSIYAETIDSVVAKEPTLTAFGLGVFDQSRLTGPERKKKFDDDRAEMYGSECEQQFMQACRFLAEVAPIATFNSRRTSYGLKHVCERWAGRYISNGMLIAAAIHSGFKWRKVNWDSPNVVFNISERSLKTLRP